MLVGGDILGFYLVLSREACLVFFKNCSRINMFTNDK